MRMPVSFEVLVGQAVPNLEATSSRMLVEPDPDVYEFFKSIC